MSLLEKLEKFLDGKKTYIVALLTGGLGIWIAMGTPEHPHVVAEWVWALLGAAGLGAVRSGIGGGSKT